MPLMSKEEAQSLARHVITGLGLTLVQLGIVQQLGIVESATGAVAILVGLGWAFLDKRRAKAKLLEARAEVPPGHVCCVHCGHEHHEGA